MPETAYATLENRFRRLNRLSEAEEILHWDLSTMMPAGGAEARGEQLAALKAVRHEILTAQDTADLLAEAKADTTLDAWRRANVTEMDRAWRHASAVDAPLVEALARACSACEAAWRRARADGDFAAVRPTLATVLDLVREEAAAKADALGLDPYDALLDAYEPDGRAAAIDVLFADLAAFLPGFLVEVRERQARQEPPLPLPGPFPIERQRALGVNFMRRFGFDFDHGRLDISLHPFCGGTPDDVRITTRYDEADFRSAFMGVMHETGHALYERGLPVDWRSQPVGAARGMMLHESQSLLVEMQVCRSRAFLSFAAPLMRDALGGAGDAWSPDNLYRHYIQVEPGYIRVDADEVTYPAHIILRYTLERAMIAGDLAVDDLPAAWNDAMQRLLGLRPPDDRLGCLQDIHWFDGAWGYFPTYTLGALAAAQLFQAAVGQRPEIADGIACGEFAPLVDWLREKVHRQASRLPTDDLLVDVTGAPLSTQPFKDHLTRRYLNGEA